MKVESYHRPRAYLSCNVCQTRWWIPVWTPSFKFLMYKTRGSLGMGEEIVLFFNWTPFLRWKLFFFFWLVSFDLNDERITPGFETWAMLLHRSANCGLQTVLCGPQCKNRFFTFIGKKKKKKGKERRKREGERGRLCDKLHTAPRPKVFTVWSVVAAACWTSAQHRGPVTRLRWEWMGTYDWQ